MFGGGGGLNPRKMKQMMEQMGIDIEDIEAEEVIIRTPTEDLVFEEAEVQRMDAQGQKTYQVVGEPESREYGTTAGGREETSAIPESDVELVVQRTGVSKDNAREALEEADGDLAAAVASLE